jgi:glucose-1-phosphate thymidylyltransferase
MQVRTGVLLAGGSGSRLAPLTSQFNKHLIPVYNRFIIDYPLQTLRMVGVQKTTIVLGGDHYGQVVSYVKDGKQFGMDINYIYQEKAAGIAQAINLTQPFVEHKDHFMVILGDNIFEKPVVFQDSEAKAQIILHKHPELHRFGVASIKDNQIVKIEEKPKALNNEINNYAIAGCYLFDNQFFKFFTHLKPSERAEYEITDIIRMYQEQGDLGFSFCDGLWSDAGTHQSINYLNNFFFQKEQT